MIGPLEMFYGWQALFCVAAAVGLTQMVKAIVDVGTGGREKRRQNPWINRVVMPAIPVVLGGLYAALIPLRPPVLIEHVSEYVDGRAWQLLAYAAWGAACGQFSSTLYDRLRELIRDTVKSESG